jgi:hypothetical protein
MLHRPASSTSPRFAAASLILSSQEVNDRNDQAPEKIETTQISRWWLNRERAMGRVRDLFWGSPFASKVLKARTGFEPVYEALQASA